jgi:hypothetical protein
MACKICNSRAINPQLHGREQDIDLDLCDVCYWRKRAGLISIAHLRTLAILCRCLDPMRGCNGLKNTISCAECCIQYAISHPTEE